jgi:hypothetical protein
MTDWTHQVADAIDNAVSTVRDKTVVPAERLVRAVVAGLLAGFFVAAAALLGALGAFRLIDVYLPGSVWSAYLLLGGIFTGLGLYSWSRR